MVDTIWNWQAWNPGEQLIVIATLIAVASFFLPWIDAELFTISGWQEYAFVFLLAYAYPLTKTLRTKPPKRWLNILSACIALYIGTSYWLSIHMDPAYLLVFPGTGVFVYLFATVLLLSGAWINKRAPGHRASRPGSHEPMPVE